MPEYEKAPEECDHEDMTYKGTDTQSAPDAIYEEWVCHDCGSFLSDVYGHEGRRIVQTPSGDCFEEEVSA